ncbi:MAG TPA: acyl carrier protein [Kofleriaceae bacterium]|jgi:acyl carrier protein
MSENQRADVLREIEAIVRAQLHRPELALTEATTARDVPGWDSLAHVGIITATEKRYKFRLRSTEMAKMVNAGSLIDVVLARGTLSTQ